MWPDSLTPQLLRLGQHPDDEGLRRVLADALAEAGATWGELLSLTVVEGTLGRRRQLERELRAPLLAKLLRGGEGLGFERGLPTSVVLSTERFRSDAALPWPWRRLTVVGDFRALLSVLSHGLAQHVEVLDLSPLWASSPYTQWVGDPPAPLPPLPQLRTLALPQGTLPAHWRPVLLPAFAHVTTLVVGLGPSDELEDWALALPRLERLVLDPRREPANEATVERARRWALAAPGRRLELFERELSPADAVHALRPALPASHWDEPETPTLKLDTQAEGPKSRVELGAGRAFFKTHDAPLQDLFTAPRHVRLVRTGGGVLLRRQVHVELLELGPPLPDRAETPEQALAWAEALVDALTTWWRLGPPDVLLGEWVALGRDQLRVGTDGLPRLIPALTRRAGPDVHGPPDFAGVPFRWTDVAPMTTRLVAALAFEWLSGLPLLPSGELGARGVHAALERTLHAPPRASEAVPALRAFDAPLTLALTAPWQLAPDALLRELRAALARSSGT